MESSTTRQRSRGELLRLWAVAVLLLGVVLASLVYATSPIGPGGPDGGGSGQGVGFVTEGGQIDEVQAEDSRSYQRSLEYYGGKSAVMMTEMRRWFAGLWHGTPLAWIIACAAGLIAWGLLHAAKIADEIALAAHPETSGTDKDGPGA